MGLYVRMQNYRQSGNSTILAVALIMGGIMVAPFAVDIPTYYVSYARLKTAVDAAALAAASKYPISEGDAQQEGEYYFYENLHNADDLGATVNFHYEGQTITATGMMKVPTTFAAATCMMKKLFEDESETGQDDQSEADGDPNMEKCKLMDVVASSTATPAARDTIIVIDTSSSMNDLGNDRPIQDVRDAAETYVNYIEDLNNQSVDRIGVVTFDFDSNKEIGLSSDLDMDDTDYNDVVAAIRDIELYSGPGWNTNYTAGLTEALDELELNGRENAKKMIIFLTDGHPNLPATEAQHAYDNYNPYKMCVDLVYKSPEVLKHACTYNKRTRKYACPAFLSPKITLDMIPADAHQCGVDYTNHMVDSINEQLDRAEEMDVEIHTIAIWDPDKDSSSKKTLQKLMKDWNWDSKLLDAMAERTGGSQYFVDASTYDPSEIMAIYKEIAEKIKVKLTKTSFHSES